MQPVKNHELLKAQGRRLLRERRIDESKYSRMMRDRVHGGVCLIHWNHFKEGVISQYGQETWDKSVDVDRTTEWKWVNHVQKPQMEHLFGINTLRLKKPLREAPHPEVRDAVLYGISWSIEEIRSADLGLEKAKLGYGELRAVWAASFHPSLMKLMVPGRAIGEQYHVLVEIADDAHFPTRVGDEARALFVDTALVNWLDSYCLYFTFMRRGWEDLLDEFV